MMILILTLATYTIHEDNPVLKDSHLDLLRVTEFGMFSFDFAPSMLVEPDNLLQVQHSKCD